MKRFTWQTWLMIASFIAINLFAFGYVVRVPMLLDDVIHFRWLQTHGLADIWMTSAGLSYYRPINFAIWKILWLLQGQHHAPTLHLINLMVHTLNALLLRLLWGLRGRSSQDKRPLFMAAALFALFPFSYQAVAWVGALSHVLVLCFMLLALILALLARRTPARLACIGSLLFTFLAPFTHEVGIMVVPLLVLMLVTDESSFALRPNLKTVLRATGWHWLVLGIALLVVIWVRGTSMGSRGFGFSAESVYQNGGYFLQGLAYGAAWLVPVLQRIGLDDMQATYGVCGAAALAWVVLYVRMGCSKSLALALGWFALCALPAVLLLNFSYVIDGPRLLYQASAGITLFWALPLGQRSSQFIAGVLCVIALIISQRFLFIKQEMYLQATQAVDQLLQAAPPQAKGPYLLVNFLRWIAPQQTWFALGHEGVSIVPEYASMSDYYWTATGVQIPVEDVEVEDVKRTWRFSYAPVGARRSAEDMQGRLRSSTHVVFTDLSTQNVIVYDAGALESQNTPRATDYLAAYDGALALISGTAQLNAQVIKVTLRWQSWRKLSQEMNTFIHIQNTSGDLVAQTDGFPLANLARPSTWQPGDVWRDTRLVPLPQNLAAGEYTVRVGVYPTAGGDRSTALSSTQARYENDSVFITRIRIP